MKTSFRVHRKSVRCQWRHCIMRSRTIIIIYCKKKKKSPSTALQCPQSWLELRVKRDAIVRADRPPHNNRTRSNRLNFRTKIITRRRIGGYGYKKKKPRKLVFLDFESVVELFRWVLGEIVFLFFFFSISCYVFSVYKHNKRDKQWINSKWNA